MALNKVENIVKPVLGDSMQLAPNYKVDRVLMGYIGNTQDFIKPAIDAIDNEGIIHYHESVPEKIKSTRPINCIKEIAKGMSVELLNEKVIKKYSPGVVHLVIDVKITK
jgi:tRNA wybutosine-synthesizing protein 2